MCKILIQRNNISAFFYLHRVYFRPLKRTIEDSPGGMPGGGGGG